MQANFRFLIKLNTNSIAGHTFVKVDVVDSTNNFAAKLLKDKILDVGSVIMADFQTKGKGQRGKEWQSEPGENLLCSMIVQPTSIRASEQFYLTMAVSLAIYETLIDLGIEEVQIKWPNDIYVKGKKICGILIESNLSGDRFDNVILGMGLNVNQKIFSLPLATSLGVELGVILNRREVLEALVANVDAAMHQLRMRNLSYLREQYHEKLLYLNAPSAYIYRGSHIEAILIGIDEQGRLLLDRTNDKSRLVVDLHEIEFIHP